MDVGYFMVRVHSNYITCYVEYTWNWTLGASDCSSAAQTVAAAKSSSEEKATPRIGVRR